MTSLQKSLLIAVTAVSVVSDSMLIPFYPQYFAQVFQIDDPYYIAKYLAIYCLVVMLAFPLWAQLAKWVAVLPLLVLTQMLAALMSVACFMASDIHWFWLSSLLMMFCKASYLLVYPFLLSRERAEKHGSTIGLLAVVVEFGAIFGALSGGVLLAWFDPRQAFLMMAGGDLLQIIVCLGLMAQGVDSRHRKSGNFAVPAQKSALAKLATVKLLFFFSAFLGYHFFTQYWASVSGRQHPVLAAAVFAIPAAMALLGLLINHYRGRALKVSALIYTVILAAVGALLQAAPEPALVILGRLIFGWALFQSFVRFDLLLFQCSHPTRYTQDYSLVRMAQSTGVLLAVYAAGAIVVLWGGAWLFIASAMGLCASLILFVILFYGAQHADSDKNNPSLSGISPPAIPEHPTTHKHTTAVSQELV
ncbi:MAG: MFS transporter [Cellvibrionaceae bacterium]|nr:MFS transporter [Cellvibrionaceae bacterium]